MFPLRSPSAVSRRANARLARSASRRLCAAAALAVFASAGGAAPAVGSADTFRIAASRAPVSLPLYVALERGFFRDEGLDVTLQDCIGGTRCLRKLIDGQAELATTSEMPVVLHSFGHGDVAIIATMVDASDNLKLIARKASGITRGEQLDGKRIGVIAGTAAQYLLETHLLTIGVDPRRVVAVPMQPEDAVGALRAGRIDAVAVWEPYGYEALHGKDGGGAVGLRLALTGGYIETYDLVTSRTLLATRDTALVKLLRAVERAEQFIQVHPADAQAILRDRLQLDQRFVDWVWPGLGFRLSLDQSLLSTMESETRWAQREGHAPAGARPNVLNLVDAVALKAVKPSAVGTGN